MTKEFKSQSKEQFTPEDKKPAEPAMKKDKEEKSEKKEKEVPGKAEHLKHPQLKGPDAQHLMNDLAYHLHHPQFGLKGPNFPSDKKPKC